MIGSSYGLTEHLPLRSTSKSACTLTSNYKAGYIFWLFWEFFFKVWAGVGGGVHLLSSVSPNSQIRFPFCHSFLLNSWKCVPYNHDLAMIKCTSGFMHVNALKIPRACALMHFANCLWRQRLSFLIKTDILIYFQRLVLQTKRCVS